MAGPARSVSPASASFSAAYWRIGIEQPVAHVVAGADDDDEGLVHQPGHEREARPRAPSPRLLGVGLEDGDRGVEVEVAGEHREAPQRRRSAGGRSSWLQSRVARSVRCRSGTPARSLARQAARSSRRGARLSG